MYRHITVLIVIVLCNQSIAYNIDRTMDSDQSPIQQLIMVRLNDAENQPIVSRETINHVHHKHEHTIGNLHVLTHINIANVITVLNASDSETMAVAANKGDTPIGDSNVTDLTNDSKPIPSNIDTEQTKFNRIERKHIAIEQRPFRFPTVIEESRAYESNLIRWPVDQPSNFAIETAPRHGNHLSPPPQQQQQQRQQQQPQQWKQLVRFPTPQTESENDASLSEHINFVTESFIGPVSLNKGPTIATATAPVAVTATTSTTTKPTRPTKSVPSLMHQNAPNNYYGIPMAGNDVDNKTSTVNQVATVDTMHSKPMIYIPDEHRKNGITKNASTNAIVSDNRFIECMMFKALALPMPSINCAGKDKTPIIPNENGKLTTAQHVSIPITMHNTNGIASTSNVLFNTQKAINPTNNQTERKMKQTPLVREEAKLYNGLPIFV